MHFTETDQKNFAKAIHAVIRATHPLPHLGCHDYAIVGSMALNIISNSADFLPQGGGRNVKIADLESCAPLCMGLFPGHVRENGQEEFHFYIARKSTEEIIDFTSCYIKQEALSQGLPWEREDLPDFIWYHAPSIADKYLAMYWPDQELMMRALYDDFKSVMTGRGPESIKNQIKQVVKIYRNLSAAN